MDLRIRLFVFCLVLCPLTVNAASESIQVKGSDTMVNLAQAWAEKFMQENPDCLVAVTGGGSGTGFASLISGTCDIAMASRKIKQKEIDLAKQRTLLPMKSRRV